MRCLLAYSLAVNLLSMNAISCQLLIRMLSVPDVRPGGLSQASSRRRRPRAPTSMSERFVNTAKRSRQSWSRSAVMCSTFLTNP